MIFCYIELDFILKIYYIYKITRTIFINKAFQMAVPKKKTSKSKRDQRRSHHALKTINITEDSTTGEFKLSHHISLKDGFYKGRQVILPKVKKIDSETE
jgi:large subunit ribosomal protein L32